MSTIFDNLPKEKWFGIADLHHWEGFWYRLPHLEAAIACQSQFEAHSDDVILASSMKTGTTWLKALIPCILHWRNLVNDDDDPLIKNHPNVLIPSLELQVYGGNPSPDLSNITQTPRLFRTHIPYRHLPESIKNTDCRLVYITRNPKDTVVSLWHFASTFQHPPYGSQFSYPFEETFNEFCNGVHAFGPFFDHLLEYWKESRTNPEKILFIMYEELKNDPKEQVKKIAKFLGKPFVNDEEVDKVLWRCSLERLKNLEVNKSGVEPSVGVLKNSYFRKGIVGDWKNYFTDEMSERMDHLSKTKLEGSGLDFMYMGN